MLSLPRRVTVRKDGGGEGGGIQKTLEGISYSTGRVHSKHPNTRSSMQLVRSVTLGWLGRGIRAAVSIHPSLHPSALVWNSPIQTTVATATERPPRDTSNGILYNTVLRLVLRKSQLTSFSRRASSYELRVARHIRHQRVVLFSAPVSYMYSYVFMDGLVSTYESWIFASFVVL